MNKIILVVGGAGYIGSHTAHLLTQNGYKVIILDNFLHNQSNFFPWTNVIKSDFSDTKILRTIFETNKIDSVMHFAALIEVGESVQFPKKFYENNVVKSLHILDLMLEYNIKKFIFSSTCAVYGNPLQVPIDETHPKNPVNPYGKTKLAVENILEDYANAYGLNYVSLRYFNAAGAYPEMNLGEMHSPETHVIPLLLQAARNKTPFNIFGSNYETKDGTCIRDFIHVRDIAAAHFLALVHLEKTGISDVFNLGSGVGFSVLELISAVEKLSEIKIQINWKERRAGDAPVLVADPSKAMSILGWQPTYSDLNFILRSAIRFDEIKNSLIERKTQNDFCMTLLDL